MDLGLAVEGIHRQLMAAAEAGGEEARSLAERLAAPLEASIRLALLDVLATAAEEITCELAPGSVELRLRGREPQFVVTAPPRQLNDADAEERVDDAASTEWGADPVAIGVVAEGDDTSMARINLRMPDGLKTRVEHAAASAGISVNAWLVRAAASALERSDPDRRSGRRLSRGSQRYTGWAR